MRHSTFLRYVGSRLSSMKRKAALGAVALACGITVCAAADEDTVTTRLLGYQETPQTINSAASGEFKATIHDDGTAIDYELTYRNLSSSPTQAHIHFGRPGLSGGVVLFLCTNLTPPAGVPTPQACPAPPATVTGTLTAANVIPLPTQGIDAGAAGFGEMLKAIRADAAYANVHTTVHPGGEIRGRLGND
jgi:CHRD domain